MQHDKVQEGYKNDGEKYKKQLRRYIMATLTCGDGGSTGQEVVTQVNANTNQVGGFDGRITANETNIATNVVDIGALETTTADHTTRIGVLETDSTAHEGRISANEADILVLQGLDPRASLRLSANMDVDLTSTFAKLNSFDQKRAERGGFIADEANHRLTNSTGKDIAVALVSLGLNVGFPGNETMDIMIYINGNPYSNSEFTLRGYGDNKPQTIYWESDIPLTNGDIIEVFAKSNSGNFTITVHRTHFSLAGIVQDLL